MFKIASSTKLIVSGLVALLLLPACGEEEVPLTPQEHCQEEGYKSYIVGHIINDEIRSDYQISSADSTPGSMRRHEIRLVAGSASPPHQSSTQPVIIRFYDAESQEQLGPRLSDLTSDGPLVLDVADASDLGPGSQNRTSLEDFDCSIAEGTICVQFGFDATGDAGLFDGDDFAFNATGGTVTILGFDNITATFHLEFDVELGPNALGFQDESRGNVQGCLSPNYEPSDNFWPLS